MISSTVILLAVLAASEDESVPSEAQVPAPTHVEPLAPASQEPEPAPATVPVPEPREVTPPVQPQRLLRIAINDVTAAAYDPHARGIFSAAIVSEVRKLAGVSVIGLDEARAIIEMEASRQLSGCTEESCMRELADALGADLVVTTQIVTLGEDDVLSMRVLDGRDATSRGVDRRLPHGSGEPILALMGEVVAELFPQFSLRSGATRGVERELARRLNPPPVKPWLFFTAVATTGLATGAASGLAVAHLIALGRTQRRIDESKDVPIAGTDLKDDIAFVDNTAVAANIGFVVAGAAVIGTCVLFFFTDFQPVSDE